MFSTKRLERAMKLFKSGDKTAFETIYNETHRLVFYIIYPIVKDYSKTEDIMQDVFLAIYEKIDLYKEDISPKAWICAIARNLAINNYQQEKKQNLVDIDKLPEFEVKENEDTPLIDLAKDLLSEEEFLIVMLCVCEGYKRREVAQLLNLSTSGVTWKLHQALDKLRKAMTGGDNSEH